MTVIIGLDLASRRARVEVVVACRDTDEVYRLYRLLYLHKLTISHGPLTKVHAECGMWNVPLPNQRCGVDPKSNTLARCGHPTTGLFRIVSREGR